MGKPRQIDSREVAHGHAKLYLWIVWLIIMVISVGYCALSFISFQKIFRVYNRDNNGVEGNVLWAVLTASFIGPATVVAFFVFGTLILLRKTIAETGLTYSYGAIHLSSLWMSVVTLMAAVSLHGQHDLIETCWEESNGQNNPDICGGVSTTLPWATSDTTLVTATYVFAYVLVFAYFVLFLVLFALRGAAKKLIMKESVAAAAAQEGVPAASSSVEQHSAKPVKHGAEKVKQTANVTDGETAPSKALSSLSDAEEAVADATAAAKK